MKTVHIRGVKWIGMLLLVAVMVFVSACGNNNAGESSNDAAGTNVSNENANNASGDPAENAGKSDEQKVTLTYWNGFTGPNRAAYEHVVKEFNASHPNIEVKMNITPWDSLLQKLPTAWKTGTGPDFAAVNTQYLPQYANAGLISPIDELYKEDGLSLDIFAPALKQNIQYKDHYYAAPANYNPLMLFYNKDIFTEAGLDPENPPQTRDEWIEAIVKTTKADGGNKQYGFVLGDHGLANWPILIWQNGGSLISEDGSKGTLTDPKTVEALKLWNDLVITKGITPINLAGADAGKLFRSGKAAMMMNGPWATNGFKEAGINFDVAPLPEGPGGSVTLANSDVMVVNKDTKHKAAVLEFMKYWNSKPSQEIIGLESGLPPTRIDMLDDSKLEENPFVLKFASVSKFGKFYLEGLEQFQKIDSDIIVPMIQAITNQTSTVEEATEKANEALNAILSK